MTTEYNLTPRFPGTELPGSSGLYKRFAVNPHTGNEVSMFCLFERSDDEGSWWYEGSTELTSALNTPLRKSRFQQGDAFEWCGIVPDESLRDRFDWSTGEPVPAVVVVTAVENAKTAGAELVSSQKPLDVFDPVQRVEAFQGLHAQEPTSAQLEEQRAKLDVEIAKALEVVREVDPAFIATVEKASGPIDTPFKFDFGANFFKTP